MKYLALIFVLGMFSAAEANQCRRVFSSFQQRMRVAKPGVLERLRNSYLNVNPSDELKVFNLEDYDEVRSQPLKDIHLDNLNLARLRAGTILGLLESFRQSKAKLYPNLGKMYVLDQVLQKGSPSAKADLLKGMRPLQMSRGIRLSELREVVSQAYFSRQTQADHLRFTVSHSMDEAKFFIFKGLYEVELLTRVYAAAIRYFGSVVVYDEPELSWYQSLVAKPVVYGLWNSAKAAFMVINGLPPFFDKDPREVPASQLSYESLKRLRRVPFSEIYPDIIAYHQDESEKRVMNSFRNQVAVRRFNGVSFALLLMAPLYLNGPTPFQEYVLHQAKLWVLQDRGKIQQMEQENDEALDVLEQFYQDDLRVLESQLEASTDPVERARLESLISRYENQLQGLRQP